MSFGRRELAYARSAHTFRRCIGHGVDKIIVIYCGRVRYLFYFRADELPSCRRQLPSTIHVHQLLPILFTIFVST